ncbi:class I SAM-dependent methyltransferase [Desulfovibrio sulfodismutans]|uniref:Class I SAM-dependent methyltransferase n=1 Tax=Desulfolutivibrio sulfodismutans TaxID=63561 RepID=A0A7K3NMM5_9BACT|nr:class I SAM-dependent methyltransferase [Desulfolutivibrio sulfodismutans]NDY57451.1 class I SAM-dependent methyltransferase [Desulfolutivibrio sulfodismutans]QLA11748.1 methyltransferase domain-containing protein [Desulfolutivibrio sulfodismutans DSM 3696]
MFDQSPRFREIFFEVYEALPRQGPGNRASAARALALCDGMPIVPRILDLGCGVGGQTMHLVALTDGHIVAVDSHAPFITQLTASVAANGLGHRIKPLCADMAHARFPSGSFDLIWSEGALYNLGLDVALPLCRDLLRPGGHLVFTDAVWRKSDVPDEVRRGFESDYPTMGWMRDVLAAVARHNLDVLGHFTLPDEAWWEDFYTPMQARVRELREKYSGDAEAQGILDILDRETELHAAHADCYAYEFFVIRRPV